MLLVRGRGDPFTALYGSQWMAIHCSDLRLRHDYRDGDRLSFWGGLCYVVWFVWKQLWKTLAEEVHPQTWSWVGSWDHALVFANNKNNKHVLPKSAQTLRNKRPWQQQQRRKRRSTWQEQAWPCFAHSPKFGIKLIVQESSHALISPWWPRAPQQGASTGRGEGRVADYWRISGGLVAD